MHGEEKREFDADRGARKETDVSCMSFTKGGFKSEMIK